MPLLQSLQSFFGGTPSSSSQTRHQARKSVINSTMDAFSLPTTRYGVQPEADSASSSPGPSRRGSDSHYTSYPPARETYQPALTAYPPLSHTFHRLRSVLSESFPELLETLNYPVDSDLLVSFETELGCPLPPPVRDYFLIADGQDLDSASQLPNGGIFYGLFLLPLEEVMREWAFWRQAEHDPLSGQNPAVLATMASVPPTFIKNLYANRGWIPLLSDKSGNYVGVDLDPGSGGAWGQVIVFGRDFDRKCVLWKGDGEGGWGKWFSSFIDELESGEGWENAKIKAQENGDSSLYGREGGNSSDEEEELGYQSYSGANDYGEKGRGLRLAGEYRGWNVLEAWWDRSVRRWESMGLGLDVEEVEKGLKEARRLAGYRDYEDDEDEGNQLGHGKGKGREVQGLGIGMGLGTGSAQVEIPVLGDANIQPPGTPVPGDSDALLPPASPDQLPPRLEPLSARSSSPSRRITPLSATSTDHPLSSNTDDKGFLSPPTRSPPRHSRHNNQPRRPRTHLPAPTPIDLPTRADVQAMAAIHQAEESGLKGGWIMNMDATGAARRGHLNGRRRSGEEEGMEDIDLENKITGGIGRGMPYYYGDNGGGGDEKLTITVPDFRRNDSGLTDRSDKRRSASPNLLGSLNVNSARPTGGSNQSSRTNSCETAPDATPRALPRLDQNQNSTSSSGTVRRPPPVANHPDNLIRGFTMDDNDRDREIIRSGLSSNGPSRPTSFIGGSGSVRVQREASTTSISSESGLLGTNTGRSGTATPPLGLGMTDSPKNMQFNTRFSGEKSTRNSLESNRSGNSGGSRPGIRMIGSDEVGKRLEDGMEEVSLG